MGAGLIAIIAGGVLCVILIFLAIWLIGLYNRLVAQRNEVKNSWAGIDVLLKRRCDLIPNLVEIVKGYAKHEKDVFEKIAMARSGMMNATTPKATMEADNMLTGALRQLLMVTENYPDLKANQNFMQLQGELTSTENDIAGRRTGYNEVVKGYNTALETFPTVIVGRMMGFTPAEFFNVTDPHEREAPKVQF